MTQKQNSGYFYPGFSKAPWNDYMKSFFLQANLIDQNHNWKNMIETSTTFMNFGSCLINEFAIFDVYFGSQNELGASSDFSKTHGIIKPVS